MKITKISEIKSFGIFKDFTAPQELNDFSQFNLFYGWNGSGKSTLAKLIACLSSKTPHPSFADGKYKIKVKDKSDITEQNVSTSDLNVFVFNSDFVQKNVDFEKQKATSILILSEERIEEMKKYKEKKEALKENASKEATFTQELNKQKDDQEKIYSTIAKEVKASFKLIDTDDKVLLNYNSPKLKQFIAANSTKINESAVLNDEEVQRLRSATKSTQLPDIPTLSSLASQNDFEKIGTVSSEALNRNVITKKIESLANDSELNKWVEHGLRLHTKAQTMECSFCTNTITQQRLDDLNAHFSSQYQQLTEDLSKTASLISNTKITLKIQLPDGTAVYEEFQHNFTELKKGISESCTSIDEALADLLKLIEEKRSNPFKSLSFDPKTINGKYSKLLDQISQANEIIKHHNSKNTNFKTEIENNKKKLELHFVVQKLTATDLLKHKDEIEKKEKVLTDIQALNLILKKEISELEAILITEVKGAEKFNFALTKFLGRNDISLHFDSSAKGYKIIRSGENKPATNLSEGEKTAVAFVYFIVKLSESSNQINNSIIVLDDPISSFDSNHLYHAYSYIKSEIEIASQLIILTHNFQFFKLLRDWLMRKNETKTLPDGKKEEKIRSRFFAVESSHNQERHSKISNAPDTLLKYGSEYHYLFQRLHDHKDDHSLDLEKAFMVANLSRKLLEGFLSFKFPRGRNNFYQLMEAGCSDQARRERVYRFINKYSHGDDFDGASASVDNLVGEGSNITNDIFQIIEDLDSLHHSEMKQLCTI